ncbi:hypothetical protein PMIT1306_00468 [Prochlorococcus sp. MIT 1306]|nr:hypothetical protein PMIT1306_00468 [Prochlorococcus sp. MIT 1306]
MVAGCFALVIDEQLILNLVVAMGHGQIACFGYN